MPGNVTDFPFPSSLVMSISLGLLAGLILNREASPSPAPPAAISIHLPPLIMTVIFRDHAVAVLLLAKNNEPSQGRQGAGHLVSGAYRVRPDFASLTAIP